MFEDFDSMDMYGFLDYLEESTKLNEECDHEDKDKDGECDKCGKDLDKKEESKSDDKKECDHVDKDKDGECDKCGEDMKKEESCSADKACKDEACCARKKEKSDDKKLEEKCNHVDKDKDGECDKCGKELDKDCDNHVDKDKDGYCDKCGEELDKDCDNHVDKDKDGYCDKCGEDMKKEESMSLEESFGIVIEDGELYIENSMIEAVMESYDMTEDEAMEVIMESYQETKEEELMESYGIFEEDGELYIEYDMIESIMESYDLTKEDAMDIIMESYEEELNEAKKYNTYDANTINVGSDGKASYAKSSVPAVQGQRGVVATNNKARQQKGGLSKGQKAGLAVGGAAVAAGGTILAKKALDKRKAKKEEERRRAEEAAAKAAKKRKGLRRLREDYGIFEEDGELYIENSMIETVMESYDLTADEAIDVIMESYEEELNEASLFGGKTKKADAKTYSANTFEVGPDGKVSYAKSSVPAVQGQRGVTVSNKVPVQRKAGLSKGQKAGVAVGGAMLAAGGTVLAKKALDKRKAKKEEERRRAEEAARAAKKRKGLRRLREDYGIFEEDGELYIESDMIESVMESYDLSSDEAIDVIMESYEEELMALEEDAAHEVTSASHSQVSVEADKQLRQAEADEGDADRNLARGGKHVLGGIEQAPRSEQDQAGKEGVRFKNREDDGDVDGKFEDSDVTKPVGSMHSVAESRDMGKSSAADTKLEKEEEEDDKLEDIVSEGYEVGYDLALFEPIKLTENEVRLVERNGNYLISESDFESVWFNYEGDLDDYEVLNKIAEAHSINPMDIIIMMSEGRAADTSVVVKKAMTRDYLESGKPDLGKLKGRLARLKHQQKQEPKASKEYLEREKKIKQMQSYINSLNNINAGAQMNRAMMVGAQAHNNMFN